MPTTYVFSIGPGATGGDNQASTIASADGIIQANTTGDWPLGRDLVSADRNLILRQTVAYADPGGALGSYTTDPTRTLTIEVAPVVRWRNRFDLSCARIASGAQKALAVGSTQYATLRGIEIQSTYTGGSAYGAEIAAANAPGKHVYDGCHVRMAGGTAQTQIGLNSNVTGTVVAEWRACVIEGLSNHSGSRHLAYGSPTPPLGTLAYNCTFVGTGNAPAYYVQMLALFKNCVFQGTVPTFACVYGMRAGSTSNVFPTGATAIGSGGGSDLDPKTGTVAFVDALSGDYRPASADTLCVDTGVSLAADATIASNGSPPFTVDANGDTWTGTWDRGAFSVAPSSTCVALRRRRSLAPI